MGDARMPRTMLAGLVAAGSAGAIWLGRRIVSRRTDPSMTGAPHDEVDEALDESFPASDPPSFAGSRGGE